MKTQQNLTLSMLTALRFNMFVRKYEREFGLLTILLLGLMMFLLTGCGGGRMQIEKIPDERPVQIDRSYLEDCPEFKDVEERPMSPEEILVAHKDDLLAHKACVLKVKGMRNIICKALSLKDDQCKVQ